MNSSRKITELKKLHKAEKSKINSRLGEFIRIFKRGKGDELFSELVFCLLTPQSKAKTCWAAVKELNAKDLLLRGRHSEIAKVLRKKMRFHNNKAKYIVEARELGDIRSKIKSFGNIHELREWLVKNVKGMGHKEAGHFLRNIGLGKGIAILDRHILRNLKAMGVIKEIPKTMTKRVYLGLEKKLIGFSRRIGIPEDHLDMLLWRKQTGEYFK